MAKKLERVVRTRKLTAEEIARDREIREKVEKEFPPAPFRPDSRPHPLSEALKRAIRQSDKSVYQIAKEADVSPIVISRFLSGERDIRLATADRLAETLGLAVPTG
ncbi:MAG: helix-turn-helix domain-containing protein [Thermoguttaceae bacterium]